MCIYRTYASIYLVRKCDFCVKSFWRRPKWSHIRRMCVWSITLSTAVRELASTNRPPRTHPTMDLLDIGGDYKHTQHMCIYISMYVYICMNYITEIRITSQSKTVAATTTNNRTTNRRMDDQLVRRISDAWISKNREVCVRSLRQMRRSSMMRSHNPECCSELDPILQKARDTMVFATRRSCTDNAQATIELLFLSELILNGGWWTHC